MKRFGMLNAVEFDDESVAVADEVTDVAADRFLSPELRRYVATDVVPEQGFRFGEVLSEFP